jgi:hypothetical protein
VGKGALLRAMPTVHVRHSCWWARRSASERKIR